MYFNLINYLVDDKYKLTPSSSFLDIGSGFGKTVFHTKVAINVKESVGIEYLPMRYNKSVELLQKFKRTLSLSNKMSGVSFQQGDATLIKSFNYSHIYCYDYVFSPSTHKKLIPILDKSPCKILVCYSNMDKLKKYGLMNFTEIGKLNVSTTGKQRFTVHIYMKL